MDIAIVGENNFSQQVFIIFDLVDELFVVRKFPDELKKERNILLSRVDNPQ